MMRRLSSRARTRASEHESSPLFQPDIQILINPTDKKSPNPIAKKPLNPNAKEPPHPTDEQCPQVDIVAHNLLTPGERKLAQQLDLAKWRSTAPVLVSDAQLAPALLNAVFSSRLRLPRSGKTTLFLVLPTEQDRRLIWRFHLSGPTVTHASSFAVVADHNAKLGDSEFQRALLGSSTSSTLWRAHSALEKDTGITQPQAPVTAPATAPTKATVTDNGPKPTAPRTIAQLTAFRPNTSRVVLGENKLTNGQVNSLVLEHLDRDGTRPVQLVRRDLSGYPNCIKFEDNRKAAEHGEAERRAPAMARPGKKVAPSETTPSEIQTVCTDEGATARDSRAFKDRSKDKTLFLPVVIETTLPVAGGELAVFMLAPKRQRAAKDPSALATAP